MKAKFFLASMVFPLAVLAISSCVKDDPQTADCAEEHEVIFDVDFADATRTPFKPQGDVSAINWDNIDNSQIHLYENGKEGKNTKITVKDGTVKVSSTFSILNLIKFKGFKYNCVIARDYSDNVLSIPTVQSPKLSTPDPAAEVIIAEASYSGIIRPIISGVKLDFEYCNVLTQLNFMGMKAGDVIKRIEITADKNIAGAFMKLDGSDFVPYSVGGSNKVTLLPVDYNTVAADGAFFTCFSSLPAELDAFSVKVVTEDKVYEKSLPKVFDKCLVIASNASNYANFVFSEKDIKYTK